MRLLVFAYQAIPFGDDFGWRPGCDVDELRIGRLIVARVQNPLSFRASRSACTHALVGRGVVSAADVWQRRTVERETAAPEMTATNVDVVRHRCAFFATRSA